ncbi:hypothetical protein JCM19239_6380 [Vibrio variabilis]|uniref:Uncharacterized protein n=1 Tax=Vibrio variabilis TaxID=990271 RepID=A0ABQ0JQ22_9VIBR|nr:hypothetical protein JCM19239_6380 [Vibrio variabilis]
MNDESGKLPIDIIKSKRRSVIMFKGGKDVWIEIDRLL